MCKQLLVVPCLPQVAGLRVMSGVVGAMQAKCIFVVTEETLPEPYAGESWVEHENMRCGISDHPEAFERLDVAKATCAVRASCVGIYDEGCDQNAPFYMCEPGTERESIGSCVLQAAGPISATACSSMRHPQAYTTLSLAQAACVSHEACSGVFDLTCMEEDTFYLCKVEPGWHACATCLTDACKSATSTGNRTNTHG